MTKIFYFSVFNFIIFNNFFKLSYFYFKNKIVNNCNYLKLDKKKKKIKNNRYFLFILNFK